MNLDLRKAKLTENGVELETSFSETFTSVNYIGFGVHKADILFSMPVVK